MNPAVWYAVAAGISALGSVFGAKKGREKSRSAAGKEAALDLRVTQEKIYQLGQEERQLAGETRAAAAGSGVRADKGSPLTILAEQARTFAREKMITAQVGAEKASLTQERGKMVGDQVAYQGYTQAVSTIGNAFAMYT